MKLIYNCPICDSQKLKRLKQCTFRIPNLKSEESHHQLGLNELGKNKNKIDFYINSCQKCGFIFLNPRFSEEDYKVIFKTKEANDSVDGDVAFYFPRAMRGYNLISKYFKFNLNYKPKVLDYGGAWGYLLIPFLKKYDCFLIDYNNYTLPKGIRYLGRNSDNLDKNLRFDVIFSIRVLEHINDPKKVIQDLTVNLNENGIIYIQVPLGCLNEWKSLDTPFRHINFFSEQSLYNLFRLSGLNIIHLKTVYHISKNAPGWKLDIIASKTIEKENQKQIKFISTDQQRKRLFYYMPLLFRKKNFNITNIKNKLRNFLRKLNVKI